MSKFGSLEANVSAPFRVEIIDPTTESVIRDKAGKASYISVWSTDSAKAREYDKLKRKDLYLRVKASRTGSVEPDDALDQNIARLAYLTDDWYLVDRITKEEIPVKCTADDAADLYSPPGMGWIFMQAWVEANSAANFLPKPPKPSTDSLTTTSAPAAD